MLRCVQIILYALPVATQRSATLASYYKPAFSHEPSAKFTLKICMVSKVPAVASDLRPHSQEVHTTQLLQPTQMLSNQGAVTPIDCVQTPSTGIKMKSSDQGSKVTTVR